MYFFPPSLFQKVVEKLKQEHFRCKVDSPGIVVAKSGCQLLCAAFQPPKELYLLLQVHKIGPGELWSLM